MMTPELAAALAEAFPGEAVSAPEAVDGGRSGATVFAVTVAGRAWIVRQRSVEHAAPLATLRLASERGVAPEVRWLDEARGIVIMERVVAVPRRPGGAARIGAQLRRLHDGPEFPKTADLATVLGHVARMIEARGGALPEDVRTRVTAALAPLARFAGTAPCHNDLNPGNVLETAGQTYFVDWDTAAMNDPYYDLACLGVFRFPTEAEREELHAAYLGRAPSEEERARLVVARVLALGFYAAAFLMMSATGRAAAPTQTLADVLASFRTAPAPGEVVAAAMAAEQAAVFASAPFAEARRLLLT